MPDPTHKPSSSADSEATDKIASIVADYLRGTETGRESSLERFCSRYPQAIREQIHERCQQAVEMQRILQTHPPDVATGRKSLGEFQLIEEIGRGGMGVVYLAEQASLARRVALKVLPAHLTLSARHVELFRHEATAAAKLKHPGIVPIHAVGESEGTHYLVMDYIEGGSLSQALSQLRAQRENRAAGPIKGRLGLLSDKSYAAGVAEVGALLAEALDHAHAHGVIHRDIKPQNILIQKDGRPLLVDFGLAKDLGQDSLSLTGEVAGTPYYMSPEQLLAKRVSVDHRTDLFSLGVVLYEMLTLSRPFEGETSQQILYEINFSQPRAIRALNPQVQKDLETICLKALEKKPDHRYQTAGEMAADLRRFLNLEPILARPAGPVTRTVKLVQRHRTAAVIGATVLALVAILLVLQLLSERTTRHRVEALVERGRVAFASGRLEAAENHLFEALRLRPGDALVEQTLKSYQQEIRLRAIEQEKERANQGWQQAALRRDAAIKEKERADAASKQAIEDRNRAEASRIEAQDARQRAERDQQETAKALTRSEGHRLLAESSAVLPSNPGLALLLAIEGAKLHPGLLANNALLAAMDQSHEQRTLVGSFPAASATFSPDGKRVLTSGQDGLACIVDAETGAELITLRSRSGTDHNSEFARFSPDGRSAVVMGTGEATIFDSTSGEIVCTLLGHGGKVSHVSFSPDSGRVVTAATTLAASDGQANATAGDRVARIFATANGTLLHELGGHRTDLSSLAFDGNGDLVATGCVDGTVRLFDAATGDLVWMRQGHRSVITAVMFSPDDDHLLTASADGSARTWRLDDAAPQHTLRDADHPLVFASYTPTGTHIVTGSDANVTVWSAASGEPVTSIKERLILPDPEIGCSADGRLLAIPNENGIEVRETVTGRLVAMLAGQGRSYGAVFSADGTKVVSAGSGKSRIFTVASGRERDTLAGVTGVLALAISRTGRELVTTARDARARVWNVASRELLLEFPTRVTGKLLGIELPQEAVIFDSISFSPDGRRMLALEHNRPHVLNLLGQEIARFSVAVNVSPDVAEFSADGQQVLVGEKRQLRVFRTDSGSLVQEWLATGVVASAAFSPDGSTVAAGFADGSVVTHDLRGGAELVLVPPGEIHLTPSRLRFSPNGELLAISHQGLLRVARVSDGTLVLVPGPLVGAVVLAFSPDSRRLFVGNRGDGIVLGPTFEMGSSLRMDSGARSVATRTDGPVIRFATFSQSGRWLLTTTTSDDMIALWDMDTGEQVVSYPGHMSWGPPPLFSPDDQLVIATTEDGSVRFWPVDPLAEAVKRKPRDLMFDESSKFDVPVKKSRWMPPK